MLHIVGDVSKSGPAVDYKTGELILNNKTKQPIYNLEVEGLQLLPDNGLLQTPDGLPAVGRRVDVTCKLIGNRKDDDGNRRENLIIAVGWQYLNGNGHG